MNICNSFITITIYVTAPFDPNPNDGGFGVGGSVSEQETDTTAIAIILPIIFGSFFIILLIVWCTACEGYKMVKSCFKGCFECCCGGLECCFDGCLSILSFFDIRRCFGDRDNGYVNVIDGESVLNTIILYIRINLKFKNCVGIDLSLLRKVRKQGISFWRKRTNTKDSGIR